MSITFTAAKKENLNSIMQIKHSNFAEKETPTKESVLAAINNPRNTFIVAYGNQKQVIGYISGPVAKERYLFSDIFDEKKGKHINKRYQMINSLVVSSEYAGEKIAAKLLEQMANNAVKQAIEFVALVCLKEMAPFYEKNGFIVKEVSTEHDSGQIWYKMTRNLRIHQPQNALQMI